MTMFRFIVLNCYIVYLQVVLVQADGYDDLYRASDRIDEEYEPRVPQRAPPRHKQHQQPLQPEGPKQPPVQTIRNYNKVCVSALLGFNAKNKKLLQCVTRLIAKYHFTLFEDT